MNPRFSLIAIATFVVGGGGSTLLAQSDFSHHEVRAVGTEARTFARTVDTRQAGSWVPIGYAGYAGEFRGQLKDEAGNPIIVATPSTAESGGFVEILIEGVPQHAYTFVHDPIPQCGPEPCPPGQASLGAFAFDKYKIGSNEPVAIVAGWYTDWIAGYGADFVYRPVQLASIDGTKDVLVASVEASGTLNSSIKWITAFQGPGVNEALAVAMGPRCGSLPGPHCKLPWDELVVVGGFFNDEMDVHLTSPLNSPNSSGGFVVLMHHDGGTLGAMALTSTTGPVRVQSVAIDPEQNVYIAGSFTGTVDFNPMASLAFSRTSTTSAPDLFVAKYRIESDGMFFNNFALEWLYTEGEANSDAAMAVAVRPDGNAFAAGYITQTPPTSFGGPGPSEDPRDIWIARFKPDETKVPPYFLAPKWKHVIDGGEDEAATGLALDPLGRPSITGVFAHVGATGWPPGTYTFDIDPNPTNQVELATEGAGIFVARFDNENGFVEEAFSVSGELDEGGTAIAFAQTNDFSLYHVGGFGGPAALNGYEVDFDPDGGGGSSVATSYGKYDAFINTLRPTAPENATIQISIIMDGLGGDINGDKWNTIKGAYADLLQNQNIVPQNGSVSINVLRGGNLLPQIVMPWTLITADTAELFAEAIRAFQLADSAPYHFHPAMNLAVDSMKDSGTVACWRTMHLVMIAPDQELMNVHAARDNALGISPPYEKTVDQINGVALRGAGVDRAWLLSHAVGAATAHGDVAFAAEVHEDWRDAAPELVGERLDIVLRRESVCPGDYNRDGVVNGVDWDDFDTDFMSIIPPDYVDWDMNGLVEPEDRIKFQDHSFVAPCPCP